jgi:hypothetical protein
LSAVAAPAPAGAANPKEPTPKFVAGLLAGGLLVGGLAGYLGSSGRFTHVLALGAVLLPVALWKRPYIAPAVLLGAAVLVEQGNTAPQIPITGRIPIFSAVGPGHLQGADMLLLMVSFIYLVKGKDWGTRLIPRTHVSLAVRAVLGCVVLAIAVGQAHHGSLRTALMQARPWVYLAATYFLTSAFVRDRRAIRALLWTFVGTVGFKALQGIYVWISNGHMVPKPESYISHEASYFFVIFVIFVAALWVFDQRGRLRDWATWLLPVVIFAIVVNNRRAAWEMLGGGFLCFGVIAYRAMPIRSGVLGKAIVGLVLCSAVYFPVMWNSTSSLASPARAIKSQINPSYRDASSDIYRVKENANLELNIKQSAPLGKGYGVKIDYALPIADISKSDPVIAWVPHNQVLDVLISMGFLGGVAVWFLIGAGIISGSRLAMARDREIAVMGLVVACALVTYALIGAVDVGFFFYRIAFITGTFLGLAEAARRLTCEAAFATSSPGGGGRRWRASFRVTDGQLWVKNATKRLATAVWFAASLATSKVRLLVVTASFAFAGALSRGASKLLAAGQLCADALTSASRKTRLLVVTASFAFAGALSRGASKLLAAGQLCADALMSVSRKLLTAAAFTTHSLLTTAGKCVVAGASFSGSAARHAAKELAAALAFAASLTTQFSTGATLVFTGGVRLTGRVAKGIVRQLAAALAIIGTVGGAAYRTVMQLERVIRDRIRKWVQNLTHIFKP